MLGNVEEVKVELVEIVEICVVVVGDDVDVSSVIVVLVDVIS